MIRTAKKKKAVRLLGVICKRHLRGAWHRFVLGTICCSGRCDSFPHTSALMYLANWVRKYRVGLPSERARLGSLLTTSARLSRKQEEDSSFESSRAADAARAEADARGELRLRAALAEHQKKQRDLLVEASREASLREQAIIVEKRNEKHRFDRLLSSSKSRAEAASAAAAAALAERDDATRRLAAVRHDADLSRDLANTLKEESRALRRRNDALSKCRRRADEHGRLRDELRAEKERREYFELLALEERRRRESLARRRVEHHQQLFSLGAECDEEDDGGTPPFPRRRPLPVVDSPTAREEKRWAAIMEGVRCLLGSSKVDSASTAAELAEISRETLQTVLDDLQFLDDGNDELLRGRPASSRTVHAQRVAVCEVALASKRDDRQPELLEEALSVLGVKSTRRNDIGLSLSTRTTTSPERKRSVEEYAHRLRSKLASVVSQLRSDSQRVAEIVERGKKAEEVARSAELELARVLAESRGAALRRFASTRLRIVRLHAWHVWMNSSRSVKTLKRIATRGHRNAKRLAYYRWNAQALSFREHSSRVLLESRVERLKSETSALHAEISRYRRGLEEAAELESDLRASLAEERAIVHELTARCDDLQPETVFVTPNRSEERAAALAELNDFTIKR